MKRWTASTWALALLLCDIAAAWGHDPTSAGNLPGRTQWVRFEIVRGRLTAACNGQPQSRTASAIHPSGCPSETLSVAANGENATVRYQLVDAGQELTAEFSPGSNVRLVREPRGSSALAKVTFEQAAGQDLRLRVEARGAVQNYSAASLWHLLLAEPAACREHLIPALWQLRSDWPLAEQAAGIEGALVESCQSGVVEQRQKCRLLVDQLGSGSSQVRREAQRELRGMGQIAAVYLSRLDPARLDAEQRHCVRQFADELVVRSGDTPERVALWMLDDQAIWLGLLAHEKPAYRHVAALQLARICNRPIEFDPAAAEIERQAQIKRLRERLAKGL